MLRHIARYIITKMFLVALTSLIVLLQNGLLVFGQERPGPPDVCIDGFFTKDAPSTETEDLGACDSWQRSSCCTAATAGSITQFRALQLYNFTWPLCGNAGLSIECENFLKVTEVVGSCCI